MIHQRYVLWWEKIFFLQDYVQIQLRFFIDILVAIFCTQGFISVFSKCTMYPQENQKCVCKSLYTILPLLSMINGIYLRKLWIYLYLLCASYPSNCNMILSLFPLGSTFKSTSMLTVSNSCCGKKSSWMFPSSSSIVDLNLKIHRGWVARSSCSYRINSRHLLY